MQYDLVRAYLWPRENADLIEHLEKTLKNDQRREWIF